MSDKQTLGSWNDNDMLKVLTERMEILARIHEAEAEVSLARGALVRVDAKLVGGGKLQPQEAMRLAQGRGIDLASMFRSLDRA